MNDHLLSTEVATVLATYSTLHSAVPTIVAGQAVAEMARPSLTISGDYVPYGHNRRKGTLKIELRSRVGDESSGQHQTAFDLLFVALFGANGADAATTLANRAAAKAALKAAVLARGAVQVIEYGPGEEAVNAEVDAEDLVTTITLRIVWLFRPPA